MRLFLLLTVLLSGCATKRVLKLENKLLLQENAELHERVVQLEKVAPPEDAYDPKPTLETVHNYLDRAGFVHEWKPGEDTIRMEFVGHTSRFAVQVQHFEAADVLFMTTRDYLALRDAQDVESVVLLLVQLAAVNYELLLGKFQLDPESGEVLLSTELHLADGLGYETFVKALERLCQTADVRYPELKRAAAGVGL